MKSFYDLYGLTAASPTIKTIPSQGDVQLSRPYETWMYTMFGGQYNKDKLTYRDYRKIMKDPQVKLALRLINTYLLSKKYHITPASEDEQDKEISEFVQTALKNMDNDMRDVRKHLLTAIPYGYSVSEIIWKINKDSQIVPSKIKGLQIETIQNCFKTDDYGEIETIIQTILSQQDPIKIPAEKCLIYIFEGETGKIYGESILKPLNDPVFFKNKVMLWLAIFLQKHGTPTIAGAVGEEGDEKGMNKILGEIREGKTTITHPAGDKVYVVETAKDGEAFFKTFQMLEVLILRVFLIGSLVLGQADNSGSYSQSQTHLDALKFFLEGIHEDLAIIFQGLIKKFVDYNYSTDKYPQFTFDPFNELDILGLMNALQPYAQNMLLDENNMEGLNQLIKRALDEYGDIIVKQAQTQQTSQVTPEEKNTPIPTSTNQPDITTQVKEVTGA